MYFHHCLSSFWECLVFPFLWIYSLFHCKNFESIDDRSVVATAPPPPPPIYCEPFKEGISEVLHKLDEETKANGGSLQCSTIGEDRGIASEDAFDYMKEKLSALIDFELNRELFNNFLQEYNTGFQTWVLRKATVGGKFVVISISANSNKEFNFGMLVADATH